MTPRAGILKNKIDSKVKSNFELNFGLYFELNFGGHEMNFGQETEEVEFKESTNELKEGIRSLVSMLNKSQHGTLYFGVKDNGDAIGQQIGKQTIRDISQAISTNIESAVIPTISIVEGTPENKQVIKIEVSGTDIPYSAYGQYLIRSADEDKK